MSKTTPQIAEDAVQAVEAGKTIADNPHSVDHIDFDIWTAAFARASASSQGESIRMKTFDCCLHNPIPVIEIQAKNIAEARALYFEALMRALKIELVEAVELEIVS